MRKPVKLFSWGQKFGCCVFFPLLKKPSVSKALQLCISVVLMNVLKNKVSQWN